jgi:hypothetical protein
MRDRDEPVLRFEFDLFAGYSQWLPNVIVEGEHLSNLRQGVIAGGTYYFNRRIGMELAGDCHFASGNTSTHFTAFVHVLGAAGTRRLFIAGRQFGCSSRRSVRIFI